MVKKIKIKNTVNIVPHDEDNFPRRFIKDGSLTIKQNCAILESEKKIFITPLSNIKYVEVTKYGSKRKKTT